MSDNLRDKLFDKKDIGWKEISEKQKEEIPQIKAEIKQHAPQQQDPCAEPGRGG